MAKTMNAIMIVGTTSHAGKSFLTTGLCRLLHRQGLRVTPFKGQNMALNAFVTESGGEIGHAQAVQAWAAGVKPHVDMNPILLKPQGDMTSQVVRLGQVVGVTNAQDYYQGYFQSGWQAITQALDRLKTAFDVIVCEGAGSPAEVNLKHRDLTNMRVAKYLKAKTILVVDIDRGGAFAHVVGTLELLEPEERQLIEGIVINKFRGQESLLTSGIEWLENYTGIPVLGILPYRQTTFSAEDSLSLLERRTRRTTEALRIVALRLPRIANFTDFEPLEAEPDVWLDYLDLSDSLGYPDAVIIPGSKTTLADLEAFNLSGMARQVTRYAEAGGTVMGICGGYQMMGRYVRDPQSLEGTLKQLPGLNLLPIDTILGDEKVTRQRKTIAYSPQAGLPVTGFEIHQGQSQLLSGKVFAKAADFTPIFEAEDLGFVNSEESLWGCYLHGLFDNGSWRRAWLNALRKGRGLSALPTGIGSYQSQRETMLDSVADFVAEHINFQPLLTD